MSEFGGAILFSREKTKTRVANNFRSLGVGRIF